MPKPAGYPELQVYKDSGKENGNYYNGLYRVYTGVQVLGSRILGRGWGEFRIMAIQNYPVGVDPYTY